MNEQYTLHPLADGGGGLDVVTVTWPYTVMASGTVVIAATAMLLSIAAATALIIVRGYLKRRSRLLSAALAVVIVGGFGFGVAMYLQPGVPATSTYLEAVGTITSTTDVEAPTGPAIGVRLSSDPTVLLVVEGDARLSVAGAIGVDVTLYCDLPGDDRAAFDCTTSKPQAPVAAPRPEPGVTPTIERTVYE